MLLDEVADLPLAMQVKLLRAIQERRVRKVGATAEEPVDVRIISATHQNLEECVGKGTFRQDLYYRLNVIELNLPPLRERLDDIGLLANVILTRLGGGQPAALTPAALEALRSYHFPGNVRELENILERALAFANDGLIEVGDLALKAQAPSHAQILAATEQASIQRGIAEVEAKEAVAPASDLPGSLPDHLDDVEREIIRRALAKTKFNRTQAAELLGISFRQLRYRMQRLDINAPE